MIRLALVADDNDLVREFVAEVLESENFHVMQAADGITATTICEEHPDLDLIVTDILMPGRNGLEFIMNLSRHFSSQQKRPKIIAISGGGLIVASHYLGDATLCGADITLPKPFSNEDLIGALARLGLANGSNSTINLHP